jgi:hypothetical protein
MEIHIKLTSNFPWDGKYRRSADGMSEEARKELLEVMAHRSRVDKGIERIGGILFGTEAGPQFLTAVRPTGWPLVDDWDCLKSMVSVMWVVVFTYKRNNLIIDIVPVLSTALILLQLQVI